MSTQDDLSDAVDAILDAEWSVRSGTVIPKTEDIVLKNGAVTLDATYVYADLADSSSLGQKIEPEVAAKVVRAYLDCASRLLRKYGGEIRSFDGDRVMAIFIGNSKNTNATRAALAVNWAVQKVLEPKFKTTWPTLCDFWTTGHGIGIDTGEAMLVRGGVRNNNDLISIGSAPNVAAKLSALRCASLHITKAVHDHMAESSRLSSDETVSMWTVHETVDVGGESKVVYWSNYWWTP